MVFKELAVWLNFFGSLGDEPDREPGHRSGRAVSCSKSTSMSTTAFSPSGEDAITRAIDIQVDAAEILDPSTPAFDEFYEIKRTASEIIDGGYKRVRREIPDTFGLSC